MSRQFIPLRLIWILFVCCLVVGVFGIGHPLDAQVPDLILHHGKIVTVDKTFSIAQAIAIKAGRIQAVGSNDNLLKLRGDTTLVVDLGGKTVLPGLMDSHTHPSGASMHEFDHPIPPMESIGDVLKYVKARVQALDDGQWISVSQVFITRLKERRFPTRQELDSVAPKNPVFFRTGPDAALNSLALKLSGIDKSFKDPKDSTGYIERDPKTGQPTGILRNLRSAVKYQAPKGARKATEQDRYGHLLRLFKDYNSVGITAIADRAASSSAVDRYKTMFDKGDLTVRVAASRHISTGGSNDDAAKRVRDVAKNPLAKDWETAGHMVHIVGVKTFLDGGMLTGSAYLREPWGLSEIYSIKDPEYRGLRFIPADKLEAMVQAAVESKLQFTAHSVGDGAVHALLDAYEAVNKITPIATTRPNITHCNFMTLEAIGKMARLKVSADIQPAWLYLDIRTLSKQFSYKRTRYFQPLNTIFKHKVIAGGGSDHMQKIGSFRSVNPYNPWLGIQTAVLRKPIDFGGKQFHPEEALTREQAIQFYTINNAYILFLDDVAGSLEPGKFADMIVIDQDVLTCQAEDIRKTKVLATYLAGKRVHKDKADK
jgi:predicted amidohydrolase YtcJ